MTLVEDIIDELGLERWDDAKVKKVVSMIIEANKKLIDERGMGSMGIIMRKAMNLLIYRAEGDEISELIRDEIQKVLEKNRDDMRVANENVYKEER